MRALTFTKYGKASEVLRVADVPAPATADVPAGFVLVKVRAASLNPVDKMRIEGKLATTPELRGFPAVVGYDVAGTVEALGEGVKGFEVGAAVAARMQSVPWQGCCAEYCVVKADKLALKPESVSFGDAAAVGLAGRTALQALRAGGVGKGSKVLVTGGAGGVGTLAIQLAKILGASTVATTASKGEKAELCSTLGADVVIDYKEQKFEDELSDFDFALDLTGETARVEAGWALSLEFAEDLQLDIPKVAGFYGAMLGASALAGSLPLSYVVRGTEHLVECGMAASVVGSALQLVAARLPDAAAARAMVGGAAIDATKLLAADASMGEWLERHGIAELGAELGDTDI